MDEPFATIDDLLRPGTLLRFKGGDWVMDAGHDEVSPRKGDVAVVVDRGGDDGTKHGVVLLWQGRLCVTGGWPGDWLAHWMLA